LYPNRDLGINRWELFQRDIKTAAPEPLSTLGFGGDQPGIFNTRPTPDTAYVEKRFELSPAASG
jgi:hypothetical protein